MSDFRHRNSNYDIGEGYDTAPFATISILSWNCRGRTVHDLHQMVKEKKPCFVFFMETLSTKTHLKRIRIQLGFDGHFVVDHVGRSGGLALLWREERELEVYNFFR
jgi:hypothetical protein